VTRQLHFKFYDRMQRGRRLKTILWTVVALSLVVLLSPMIWAALKVVGLVLLSLLLLVTLAVVLAIFLTPPSSVRAQEFSPGAGVFGLLLVWLFSPKN